MTQNHLKQNLKPSKTTKYNQHKNLTDSPKVFVLGFRTLVWTWFSTRDADLTIVTGKNCALLNSVKTQFCLASSDFFHLFTQSVKGLSTSNFRHV